MPPFQGGGVNNREVTGRPGVVNNAFPVVVGQSQGVAPVSSNSIENPSRLDGGNGFVGFGFPQSGFGGANNGFGGGNPLAFQGQGFSGFSGNGLHNP